MNPEKHYRVFLFSWVRIVEAKSRLVLVVMAGALSDDGQRHLSGAF